MEENKEFINVKKIIEGKNPKLAKLIPGFVIGYLKRVIHQDTLNRGLNEFGHLKNSEFIERTLDMLEVTFTIEGLDSIDPADRYIFASNHPLGGLDGMMLIRALREKFGEIKVPSNDLLMNIAQLQDNFIPVNKHGGQSKDNARLMEDTYASDIQMFIFPAGLCSRKQKGGIKDLEWKKNFVAKAVKHKRSIVPILFIGRNSNFFYNLSRLRTFLGLKVNIEMLYLVDEMFRQKGNNFHAIVGKPIPYQTFDATRTPSEWANWVKEEVYKLKR